MKKIGVNNDIFDQIFENLNEVNYPQGFEIEKFKNISSFKARLQYAEEYLQKLASGSSRRVFKVDDETVLKVAMNSRGLAQNEAEIDMFYRSRDYLQHIFAKIYDDDPKYTWLLSEYAPRAKNSDFIKYIGVDFEAFSQYIRYNITSQTSNKQVSPPNLTEEEMEILSDSDFAHDVCESTTSFNMDMGDLLRIASYGVTKDGLVLIDYGGSKDVIDQYYSKR